MRNSLTKTLLMFCSFSVIFNSLSAASFEDQKKAHMIQDLEIIKHHYDIGYAPAQWKKDHLAWNLEEAFEEAKNQVLATPSITTKQFQGITRHFIQSMRDYHVDVIFFSTEKAALPFSVKGAEGRYFIDWLDPLRLPPSHYAIRVGDELLQFDERPIAEVIEDLKKANGKFANPSTDQVRAEINLTYRSGMSGDTVPQGSVVIKTRSADSTKVNSCQLCWSYTPEHVKNPLDFIPLMDSLSFLTSSSKVKEKPTLPKIKMVNPLHESDAQRSADRRGGLGAQKSFIPLLGEVTWTKEEDKEDKKDDLSFFNINWHAYIYRHPEGQSIGYIRIPHYIGFAPQAKAFGKILNYMEEQTDALVIDQVHNFGGFVNFQYELASMLAIEPLKAPYHRVKITQKDALEAYEILEFIKLLDLELQAHEEETTDSSPANGENEEANSDENKEEDIGFNYQEIMFLKAYYELVLEEWNQGHTLTRPTPIVGVDRINPHPKYQYTKPILMLINEMDFSGGDFMPAILQDNQRAVLFGNRTAGAGGFVFSFEFPNTHGIARCSYTASIAERVNLQKIEDLGVTPDINYQIKVEDLQQNYRGYIEAVNRSVHLLLENTQK